MFVGVGFSTIRYFAGDVGQQSVEKQGSKHINWERALLFTSFGFFYAGIFSYGLYSKIYPMIFDRIKVPIHRAITQTVVDMSIHSPFVYFPAFYIFKAFVYEKRINVEMAKKALHQYFYVNFWDDMKHLYVIWTPSMFMAFFVIPTHLRLPWLNLCGIGWVALLSVTRGE